MSRYQQRLVVSHPEKNVPDNIRDQFFLAIKTADLDKIRDFANQYKNKFSLIEKGNKERPTDTGKTPFHVVLELDDKVADENTKLRIMHYLDQMGAPMDLPDSADVWPIHLAAALQSEEIVDFLLSRHVSIDRKDSSNNTPLHYAIYGKMIPCPQPVKIKDLAPEQKIDKKPLNKVLEDSNTQIISLLSSNKELNRNLIHMINTIMKIPLMYANYKISRQLETELVSVFTEVATTPIYSGELTGQQTKLEQLINRYFSIIDYDILKGVIRPLEISANSGGWGPMIPTAPNTFQPPNNMQRILKQETGDIRKEAENELANKRALLNTITPINRLTNADIPTIIRKTDSDYMEKLIFSQSYGENVAMTKMLFLLVWNYYKAIYPDIFVKKIMDNFIVMDPPIHSEIRGNAVNPNHAWSRNRPVVLFERELKNIVADPVLDKVRSNADIQLGNLAAALDGQNAATGKITNHANCIGNNIRRLFTSSNDQMKKTPFSEPINLSETDLGSLSLSDLLSKEEFRPLRPNIASFKPELRDLSINWFTMLNNLIELIRPYANPLKDGKDRRWNNVFLIGWVDPNTPVFGLPYTPLPYNRESATVYEPNEEGKYTYHEAFQVLNALAYYLLTKDPEGHYFEINDIPSIYGIRINEWDNFIDMLANSRIGKPPKSSPILISAAKRENAGRIIGDAFPEFIFLFRILVKDAQLAIQKIIKDCIEEMVGGVLDDAYLYNLLLPEMPDPTEFVKTPDPYADLKALTWTTSSDLIKWFNGYYENIPIDLRTNLENIFFDSNNIGHFNHADLNVIRNLVETNVPPNLTNISTVINDGRYRNAIRQYFGTYVPDIRTVTMLISRNVPFRYHTITGTIKLQDQYDQYLSNLRTNAISQLLFLVEIVGHYFVTVKQMFLRLSQDIALLTSVVADIIAFINNKTYYYIPQIFLPALVKQILVATNYLITIRNEINQFTTRKTEFLPWINTTVPQHNDILTLADLFTDFITGYISTVYVNIGDLVSYHNNVIDYLNMVSAFNLMNSTSRTIFGRSLNTTELIFTMNLIPLETLPDLSTASPNMESLLPVFRLYQISETTYHADGNEDARLRFEVFGDTTTGTLYPMYRNIIPYKRSPNAQLSNSPNTGDNSQLNIVSQGGVFLIFPILDPIPGEWLDLMGSPINVQLANYYNAFIAYDDTPYTYDWLDGMPPSIRRLLNYHLRILKQQIIEETVQFIINNHAKDDPVRDPTKNIELAKMFDELKTLGTEPTFADLDDVKVYIILAKLVDSTLNNILEYAVKQSITTWIYQFATRDYRLQSLTNEIEQTISIVRQRDYLKLSLSNINDIAIKDLDKNYQKYLDIQLAQIEPNPSNIEYSTPPVAKELVHYLYDINYFSQGNINRNHTCYQINPIIASKLTNSNTLNAKNSDGNTPLHVAIYLTNPDLVEMLVAKGANPKGFTNNHGYTPYDLGLMNMEKHISFGYGNKVIDSINHFVIPFNDLLLARLKDEKYGNNIIKNITMGIPIQLVIYNHMFYLYLQNYRYNFSSDLKAAIQNMYSKYYHLDMSIYPIDLFQIDRWDQLARITRPEIATNRISAAVSAANQKKIEKYQKQLQMLNNQLDGLKKELTVTTDPEQAKFINDIMNALQIEVAVVEAKLSNITVEDPKVDTAIMSAYLGSVKNISRKVSRNTTITEFYQQAFQQIGRSHELYINVWNNYLQKDLSEAPSMIFPLLSGIVHFLMDSSRNGRMDAAQKMELTHIVHFYGLVKDYIESKNPTGNMDDDPTLREEMDQIVYLINLILTPAIYHILLNQIYQGLREMEGANTILRDQTTVLDSITSTEFQGKTMESYLRTVLPRKIVKLYTSVYDNEYDADRKTTSVSDLFLPIIQTIKRNNLIVINDDSLLIQNLRDYLIPFMASTYQNFIHHLRLAVYGYERYLLNTYAQVRILQSLI